MSMELLNQLREKYQKASEKYGEKIFNLRELESRITHLLNTRGNVEIFLKGEMQFFEKAMNIAVSKEEELKKRKEAQEKVDAIMSANEERIVKYKDIFFDPGAPVEVRRLVGAITEWHDLSFPLIKYLYRGADIWGDLAVLQGELERFYVPSARSVTPFLQHYADEMRHSDLDAKEKTELKLMQTCANSMYKLEKILKKEMEGMPEYQRERFINMSPSFDKDIRDHWSKHKEYEAVSEVTKQLGAIIDDFRLRDLSALGFKNNDG